MMECTSRILSAEEKNDHLEIALDRTIFFPEGGGQPGDRGWLNDAWVYDVHEKDGVVYHLIRLSKDSAPSPDNKKTGKCKTDPAVQVSAADLKEGDEVNCLLDWEWRFANMQRHLGEHILSGVFAGMYGGANRGFHMGDSYVTVDIRLENDPSFDKISWDMCMAAEKEINRIIWSDLPVSVSVFSDPGEAKKMPLRKELNIEDEEISIVTVGEGDNIADCVACCGTHPAHTAQVGLVKIYKVEKNKDMFRIYFDCGMRAMADYDEKHRIITDISDRHSAGLEDLEKKMAAEESKNSQVRAHLNTVVHSLAKIRAQEILDAASAEPDKVIFRRFADMDVDDIMKIGKIIGPELKKPALLLSENEHTVLLFSDGSIHCGNLVRENAGIYGGKGGGSDVQARAIFSDNSNTETFADLIDKHLR